MVLLESGFQNQQIWVPVPALSLADIILGKVLDRISYLSVLRVHPPMVSERFLLLLSLYRKHLMNFTVCLFWSRTIFLSDLELHRRGLRSGAWNVDSIP